MARDNVSVSASQSDEPTTSPHDLPEAKWADLDGPVHYLDFGGPADGPTLVLVHGLGGSVLNWVAVGPALAESCRVLAIDLAGFGRTHPLGRSTHIDSNRELLARFLDLVVGGPAVIVGNSMGGLLAMLLADSRPDLVSGLALIDPALPVGPRAWPDPLVAATFATYAVPALARRLVARRRTLQTPEEQALAVLRLCCVDATRVPDVVVDHHLALARERADHPDLDAEIVVAGRSLLLALARRRWLYAVMRKIRVPVLLLHGSQDRLVPLGAARAVATRNPRWRFEVADDVGHVPQLEVPDWTSSRILDWLGDEGSSAAKGARRQRVERLDDHR